MTTPKVVISRLEQVDIRFVWPTEPHHFTPWLLDNAELLSEALGLRIELDDREHSVGAFSLDLIGRVSGSDQVVIVENQFGATDHSHLGQILTYAGGTSPTVIIWIAETFRDEHRAALDWLNLNTPTDVRFFGVALSAVRIGNSESHVVAPRFDVVSKPNDWEKLARQESATESGPSGARKALYQRFWALLGTEAKSRKLTTATPPSTNWWTLQSVSPGFSWIVSYMQGGVRSELYIDTGNKTRNEFLAHQLELRQPELSEAFGAGGLSVDLLPKNRACRVETRKAGPVIVDESTWDEVRSWMLDTQTRLRAAVNSTGGLPVGEPPAGWVAPYETGSVEPSDAAEESAIGSDG